MILPALFLAADLSQQRQRLLAGLLNLLLLLFKTTLFLSEPCRFAAVGDQHQTAVQHLEVHAGSNLKPRLCQPLPGYIHLRGAAAFAGAGAAGTGEPAGTAGAGKQRAGYVDGGAGGSA